MNEDQRWVLTVACPSKSGQVAAISGFLDSHGCYINEFSCFDDDVGDRFFVRAVFRPGSDKQGIPATLREQFQQTAARSYATPEPVTLSIGAQVFEQPPASLAALIEQSDAALYVSKRGGRDSIHLAERMPTEMALRQP